MSDRRRRLQSLVIQDPCTESWAGMTGDDRQRHCARCDRPVHDFAEHTAAEILALLQRHRGQLCGRITRDERGRLVSRPEPLAPSAWRARRPSQLAAAVLSALLGAPAAVAAAQRTPEGMANAPVPAVPAAPGAPNAEVAAPETISLRGQVLDEQGRPVAAAEMTARNVFDGSEARGRTDERGRFRFKDLPPGLYRVEGDKADVEVHGVDNVLLAKAEAVEVAITANASGLNARGGSIAVGEDPLFEQFFESELVVLGVAGVTVPADPADPAKGSLTTLINPRAFKGSAGGKAVRVFHHGAPDEYPAGQPLLALLTPAAEPLGGGPVWTLAPGAFRLRAVAAEHVAPLREHLTALAELEPGASRFAEELVEWLVAAAVEPATREDGAGSLASAFYSLADFAAGRQQSRDHAAEDLRAVYEGFLGGGGALGERFPPSLLAALMTEAQQDRLTAGLLDTQTVTWGDVNLAQLVAYWAAEPAQRWRHDRFLRGVTTDLDREVELIERIAEDEEDPTLRALVEEAWQRLGEIGWAEAATADRQAVQRQLARDARAALGGRR